MKKVALEENHRAEAIRGPDKSKQDKILAFGDANRRAGEEGTGDKIHSSLMLLQLWL